MKRKKRGKEKKTLERSERNKDTRASLESDK